MKFLQIEPLFAVSIVEYELKNKNLGMVTVHRCRAWSIGRDTERTVWQKNACGIHLSGLQRAARDFNPHMRVRAITLPPRHITWGIRGGTNCQ